MVIMPKMSPTILALLLTCILVNGGRECSRSQHGFDYMGTLSHTKTGLPCQAWSSQLPHSHNFDSAKMFPDPTVADAADYCRSPDGIKNLRGPWCFTTDPDVRKQHCNIPECSDFPECRLTEKGLEYHGTISVTSSGRACSAWPFGEGEENYCRNPEGRPSGLYCYVDNGNATESCSVPFCKPQMFCKQTKVGKEYSGSMSVTRHGHWCQPWASQYPHAHKYTDPGLFPDATLGEAGNFCRNPGGVSADGPWCYTTDPAVLKDYCDISICRDCKLSTTGQEYSGTLKVTASGLPCLRWDHPGSRFTDPSRFPDLDVATAANFCRNPDNRPEGPWCFTSDAGDHGHCDVTMCTDKSPNVFRPAIAKHVIHIGVDGLRPDCIGDAPGGAPNLLTRLASEGTHTLTRARTSLVTTSAAGWSSQLLGLDGDSSGVIRNIWSPPWRGVNQDITPVTGNDAVAPGIFHQLKAQDPALRTAAFYNWHWLGYMTNVGFPGAVDVEERQLETYNLTDPVLVHRATAYLQSALSSAERTYTFLFLGNVDESGHKFSWCRWEYNEAVATVDRQIGKLLDVIDEHDPRQAETLVLVTTDHGGSVFWHTLYSDQDLLVPMFVRGAGVRRNHTFRNNVYNVDVAPTVAHALGLKPSPYWVGRVMEDAFED